MLKCPMRVTHRFLSSRWFVGLLTDLFMRRGFSPLHKRIASAFSRSHDSSSNDRFSPHAGCVLHGKQYFRKPALLRLSSRAGFVPCPGFSPDSLVQRTRMRVRLLGSRICHKSHAIQFIICAPNFTHTKRPLLPCYLADKRSLVFSVYSV